jgi:Cu/Ag efflux protein CusF
MARELNDAEMALAIQLFSLADAVSATAQVMLAKKKEFTAAQGELRIAEANLQKAQEELATFMKNRIGLPGS